MKLHRLDLNLLVAFDALMAERNVSKAAEKLFISQSAMSHSLNRLRQALDDPILVRTSNGMTPTKRAEDLIVPIRKALSDIEQTVSVPQEFVPGQAEHRFVIAATDYNELILIPELVKRIRRSAPGVAVHVRQTREYLPKKGLEAGSINIVLGFDVALETPSTIKQHALFDDVFVSVVRKGHPDVGDELTLEQYVTLEHALISPLGSGNGIIDHWLSRQGLTRKVVFVVPHFLSAPLIIAQTDLVLTLPYRVAEKLAALAPLKLLKTPIALPRYQLSMIWHPLYDKLPADRWLRTQVLCVSKEISKQLIPSSF